MNNESAFESNWRETQDVHQRTIPQIVEYNKTSAGFGMLIIKSALVLNGGALLALPAYISAVKTKEIAETAIIYSSAMWFIGGIIFAALTAYCAYINYQAIAMMVDVEGEKEIAEIEEGYDTTHRIRLSGHRQNVRTHWAKWEKRYSRTAVWTMWLAQIFGFASYLCFCVGSYYGGLAMLSS